MGEHVLRRRWQVLFCFATALAVILSLAGCYKKSGEALVLEKEHIAVREATPTPQAGSSTNANEPAPDSNEPTLGSDEPAPDSNEPTPGSDESAPDSNEPIPGSDEPTPGSDESAPGANASTPSEETVREMREDEIDVDGYVMKKNLRGTSKDPRAVDHEQWIVLVKMITDLRLVKVQTDQTHWNKLKVGDRIKVSYHQGKYTGTVWESEIEE